MLQVDIITIIIAALVIFGIAIAIWLETANDVSKSGPSNINKIVSGAVLWGFGNAKKKRQRKKGIVITTTLLATIVFFLVFAFLFFLIIASGGGEAGPSSNSFFYGVFDSIIRSLPWVS